MELHLSNAQLYEALREQIGKERAAILINNIVAQVKSEVNMQTRGLATNEQLATLETSLVREFNNKLLVYSIGTVVATVLSLCLLAQFFIK